ncbi:hypothetical protein [Comamonas serinivorans]|nr:hypothetical protein [Comamonas serinivorans]
MTPPLARLVHDLQSPSGWTREAALKQLADGLQPYSPALLPLLMRRLNDWVGPVRRAAEVTLARWEATLPIADLLACADALDALARGGRADPRWAQRLRARLTDSAQALPRLKHMVQHSPTQAVFAWQCLRRAPSVEVGELALLGLNSRSLGVVMQATRLLPSLHSQPALWLACLQRALTHRQGSVRAQALRSVPADWRVSLPPHLHQALRGLLHPSVLDTSASARWLAVARLDLPADELCQATLAQWPDLPPRRQAGALQLLADLAQPTGHAQQSTALQAQVLAALDAQAVAVRQSAHVAALRLGVLTPAAALARSVHDGNRVYRAVWHWCRRGHLLSRSDLEAAGLIDADWRAVDRNARVQALLQELDPWEALLGLLQQPADGHDLRHHDPQALAQRWLLRHNRGSVRPTPRQWADIQALLAAGRWGAFTHTRPSLQFVLDAWS